MTFWGARRYQIRGSWSVNESKRVSSRPTPANGTIEFPSWTRELPAGPRWTRAEGKVSGAIDPTSPRTFGFVLSNPGIMKEIGSRKRDSSEIFSQDETESFSKIGFLVFPSNYNFIHTNFFLIFFFLPFQGSIFIMRYNITCHGKEISIVVPSIGLKNLRG